MTIEPIRFDDGASYELMMGRWSLLAGAQFIDWIDVPDRSRWLDVGCGNGGSPNWRSSAACRRVCRPSIRHRAS